MTYQSRPQQPPAADVDAAGPRNLINVGEDKQGPWAGWGIGSYADSDEERNSETYAWRDELIEPGSPHQRFVGGGSAADRKGVPRHQAVLEKGQAGSGGPVVFAHPDAVRQKDYYGNDVPVSNLTLYATSTTGEIWDFPALGLFEWEGSTENSIAVDPTGPQLYHVIRDESAPA